MHSHGFNWWIGLFLGSLGVGALLGLIPLLMGLFMGQKKLGTGGFFACLVAGLATGLRFTPVVAALAALAVYRAWRKAERGVLSSSNAEQDH
jgi:hypothetical protein